jgi:phage terminase small subunit
MTARKKKNKLTNKQRAFVENYLANGFNATQAASDAGYSGSYGTLRSIGSENLTKPNIQEVIQERMSELGMAADEVLARLATVARGVDITPYVTIRERYGFNKKGEEFFTGYAVNINIEKLREDGYSHLIRRVFETRGGMGIEWQDPVPALIQIGRHHGLFVDRVMTEKDISEIQEAMKEELEQLIPDKDERREFIKRIKNRIS